VAISQNYAGRIIDLCVFNTSNQAGLAAVTVGLIDSGSVISGSYKVVQKFMKFLLTSKGTVAADLEYGTDFISRLTSGQIQTNSELSLRFNLEVATCKYFVTSANLTAVADETLRKVDLTGLSVTADTAILTLLFTFADKSTILAPVTISTI